LRQLEVLAAYVDAKSARTAAAQLGIAESTVKNLLSDLKRRLGARSVTTACVALGWLLIPDLQDAANSPSGVDVAVLAAYAQAGTVRSAAAELGLSAAGARSRLTATYGVLHVHCALAAYQALGWLRLPKVNEHGAQAVGRSRTGIPARLS
jgi:DNA-binding CsgD family transcriptional regulator